MAGDWIKMRTDLYRDPKVSLIADALMAPDSELSRYVMNNCQRAMTVTRNVMRNVTVGALVSVWGVMRQRGKRNGDDLVCHGVTLVVLDDIADLPGFGAAVALCGWVRQTAEGLEFPRFFDEYNVSPEEKSRSSGAERQRRYRQRHGQKSDGESDGFGGVTGDVTGDVTDNVTVTPREEKNREEKENTPQPPTGGRQRRSDAGDEPQGFSGFWSVYPRKVGKDAARKAFAKRKPDAELLAKMLAAVAIQAKSAQWQRDGGQYIPHPSTWLNEGRWDDGEGEEGGGGAAQGDSESRPQWALQAGFENRWEAENERCYAHNAHLFRDGRRMEAPA